MTALAALQLCAAAIIGGAWVTFTILSVLRDEQK